MANRHIKTAQRHKIKTSIARYPRERVNQRWRFILGLLVINVYYGLFVNKIFVTLEDVS